MLVLERRLGEKIVICDGDIVVSVEAIRGDRVRLGIEADRSVPIDRQEIHEARRRQRESERGPR